MQFVDYLKQNFDSRISKIFDDGTYGQCTAGCRQDYYDCMRGCPDPPDPTNCASGCRDTLSSCLNGCTKDLALVKKMLTELDKIEAMALYTKVHVR